ncbi:MAG TPA: TonB-dependent receptor [Myxococcaceae bacterium]|nr:TonB-dependent receptor [Myxococcaceae bacterium]
MANRYAGRRQAGAGLVLVLLFGALPAWGARPGAPDAGVPDAGTRVEVGVQRTDSGFALEASGPADAGPGPAFLPPTLLTDSPAMYPAELASERVTGSVKLELLVDDTGQVESATLVQGAHRLLDDSALHAATRLRFTPATLDGQPVPVRLGFEYRFEAPPEIAAGPGDGGTPALAPVTLKGLVRTMGNRRPIPGAVLVSDAAKDQPVETDAQGRFEARWPGGGQRVRVTAPGHKPSTFLEPLRSGETLEVVYGLEPLIINPYETVVRGDRERTEVSRVTLRDAELREIPGTMGDPFRVVMLLPGVGSMLSGVAYPVVRGSQPSSTGYYLDGIRVPILFHLFLGPAVLHPDFIDTIDFYPGTPPPKYGRLMGGAIDGRLSRPRDDRVHGSAYMDLINAGVFLEYPFESTGTNISVAGRYSYTPWIIALAANAVQPEPPPGRKNDKLILDFWDYQLRVEQEVGEGRTRLFTFGSSDTFGVEAQDEFGSTGLQTILFHRADVRHRHPVAGGDLEVGATWGLDRLGVVGREGLTGQRTEFHIDNTTWALRAGYEKQLAEGLTLRSGADLDHKRANVEAIGEEEDGSEIRIDAPVAIGTFTGAWGELLWDLDDKWTVLPGLRVDNYHLSPGINKVAVEPRLTVRRKLSEELTLRGGAGLFHQAPTTLISVPVIDIAALNLGLQQALQFSVGAEWRGWKALDVNVDVYVNPMTRTVELTPFSNEVLGDIGEPDDQPDGGVGRPQLPDFSSRGLAYGLEVLLRRPLGGNWFGWVSYTLQRSTRLTRFRRLDEAGDPMGEVVEKNLPFVFDQTHILNLVVSYKFANNVTLGGVLHFNTGRPEAGVLGSQTSRIDSGGSKWVAVDRDQVDRLPPFFRFDVRLAKAWAYDTFSLEAYLDMLNVTISREVVGFSYVPAMSSTTGKPEKQPNGVPIVVPILGLKGRY